MKFFEEAFLKSAIYLVVIWWKIYVGWESCKGSEVKYVSAEIIIFSSYQYSFREQYSTDSEKWQNNFPNLLCRVVWDAHCNISV